MIQFRIWLKREKINYYLKRDDVFFFGQTLKQKMWRHDFFYWVFMVKSDIIWSKYFGTGISHSIMIIF